MGRQLWKPGNMLYPVPAVMVTCSEKADNRILLRCMGGNSLQFSGDGFNIC